MECVDKCVTFLVITFGLLSGPCVDGTRIETAVIDQPWIRNSDIALNYMEYCQRITVMGLDIVETPRILCCLRVSGSLLIEQHLVSYVTYLEQSKFLCLINVIQCFW